MNDALRQLDRRLHLYRNRDLTRPFRGWLRAIRNALGMTTAQLARRLKISQPRIVAIEKAEVSGAITLKTLERTAAGVGCRVFYILVPEPSLSAMMNARADEVAERHLRAVEQTMALEGQAVTNKKFRKELHARTVARLLRTPARLWDEEPGATR